MGFGLGLGQDADIMRENLWILEHPRAGIARSCDTILVIVNERRAHEMERDWQTAGPAPDCMLWKARQLTDAEMEKMRKSGYTKIR